MARRILNALAESLRRLANIALNIACGDVYKNEPDQFSVLTAHGGRTGLVTNVSEQVDRHLRTGGRGDKHAFECVDVLPKITGITRVNRVTLAPLNGGRDILAADGRLNNIVHIADFQAVARGRFAVDGEVEEIAAHGSLSESAS